MNERRTTRPDPLRFACASIRENRLRDRGGRQSVKGETVRTSLSFGSILISILGACVPNSSYDQTASTASALPESSTTVPNETWAENLRAGVSGQDLEMFACGGLRVKIEERAALIWSRLDETEMVTADNSRGAEFVGSTAWSGVNHLATTRRLLRRVTDPLLEAVSERLPTDVQSDIFLNDAIASCGLKSFSEALNASAGALDDRLATITWNAHHLPWYPDGFEESFPGVAFKKSERGLSCYSSCRGIVYEVVSEFGCPNQLYVQANFLDSNGAIFDWSNDVVYSLPAGRVAYVELYTYSGNSGQGTVLLTNADCF